MAQTGDIVRFLNSVGGGTITRIQGNIAYVEDEDGFETPVLLRECVVVGKTAPEVPAVAAPASTTPRTYTPTSTASAQTQKVTADEPLDVEETPEGEQINLTLAYEPRNIKAPTTSEIDIYLVNDSNYYLSFTYQTRGAAEEEWTCRYAGVVEPNIQLLLGELDRKILGSMDKVMLQFVAYKQGKSFKAKAPMAIEMPLDATKFFKLHCYKPNIYFETPVIALEAVTNDHPYRDIPVDGRAIAEAMKQKVTEDLKPRRRPVQKKQPKPQLNDGNIVVDLHIQELVDNIRGLSNADMLNLQIDEFRRVMDANLKNKGCKIVFIHGKGEGVLRQALIKELNHRYKGHQVQDASFREYGFGATQVTIR